MIYNWEARAFTGGCGRTTKGTVEADTPRAAIAKVAQHLWEKGVKDEHDLSDELSGHTDACISVSRFVPGVR